MASVRRGCTVLGVAATCAALLVLGVMLLFVEAPQLMRWFLASAALAASAFAVALLAAYLEG